MSYRRKDGLLEKSVNINGKRVRFYGKTEREINKKILEYKDKITSGRTVTAIAVAWQEQKHGTDSTVYVYGLAADRIQEHFGSLPVKKLTALDCQRFIHSVEQQGYSASTVDIYITVLRQMLDYAVIAGDIDINPMLSVKKSKGLPVENRSALTTEQEQLVLSNREADWWLFGVTLLLTGCRKGEALALTYEDIDRSKGIIHISKKLNYISGNRPVLEDYLKNSKSREQPLLPQLADVLPVAGSGLLFPGCDGGYMSAYEYRKAWKQYTEQVGIDGTTAHQFRHSYATLCYEAGLDDMTAAAYLGDTIDTTKKIYTELRNSHKQKGIDKLSRFIDNLKT